MNRGRKPENQEQHNHSIRHGLSQPRTHHKHPSRQKVRRINLIEPGPFPSRSASEQGKGRQLTPSQQLTPQQTTVQPDYYTRSQQAQPAQIRPTQAQLRAVRGSNSQTRAQAGLRNNRQPLSETPHSRRFKSLIDSGKLGRKRKRLQNSQIVSQSTTPRQKHLGRDSQQRHRLQPARNPRGPKVRRYPKPPDNRLVYGVRLLIMGIGLAAIGGTLLSSLEPTTRASVQANETAEVKIEQSYRTLSSVTPLPLRQEIPQLKAQMHAIVAQNPNLQPGVFLLDLDTGAYLDWDSRSTFAAASTIKVPILVAFFQALDAGKVRLDETLIMESEMIATGSGDMQYQQPGTQYTALEVITKMIAISDNTASNMIIARLGGAEALNQQFRSWGLATTAIRNLLPDLEGTNTTSPREIARLMSIVNQGQLLSLRSRDRLLDIMRQTQNDSLLPQGLGNGATIAHKTGNIGSVLADVGIVDMPTGKRYLIAVMVKRPHDDASAQKLIRDISRTAYDYFNEPRTTPNTTSMPTGSTATLISAITPHIKD
ncbi:MAG: serine hydrolase [Symploca sp. SIO1C4]|uniref:Serine hydrolase n=1 Tax=Symploca sp. SIO1C4 TaxID=2607765 RepID=A0A6B3NLY9_9CYAN|nr:serine hydrolase [Symploca sp. SIO1C4]